MRRIQIAAVRLFDELVPGAGAEHRDPFGRAEARSGLLANLSGATTRERKLFTETLDLPAPVDGRQPTPARMAPPPHRDDRSLPAIAWRWRNETESTAAGRTDLAKLTHVHTLEQAREIGAARTLADNLSDHCDADTATIIAAALALTRDDGAFTAAHIAGRQAPACGPALRRPAFRSLLQTPHNELIEPLRRLIQAVPDRLIDRRALAAGIAAWGPRVRREWTDEYLHCRTEPVLAIAYERSRENEAA